MSDDEEDEDEESDEGDESEDDEHDEDEGDSGNAWASTSKTMTEDTLKGLSTAMSSTYGCCHISHNNLNFLIPMRRDCKWPVTLTPSTYAI